MKTSEAIRIVAQFDGWRLDGDSGMAFMPDGSRVPSTLRPDYANDRDAIVEVAKKLETTWKREWGYKVVYALGRNGVQFHEILTASRKTMLLELAATITEMNQQKDPQQ